MPHTRSVFYHINFTGYQPFLRACPQKPAGQVQYADLQVNSMRTQTSRPNSPLLTAPIPGLLRQIATPVSTGAFFSTMFNVVDTIYGGAISDQALAALSLSFPIYFILVALSMGFSTGGTALMGNAMGRGDKETAQHYAIQGLVFGLVIAILTTIIIVSAAPALVSLLGATEPGYQAMVLAYIQPIFYGTVFFITVQMLQAILNTLGRTKPGRNFLIAGFILNLGLDPWFIFGGLGVPAMGITGIALATVLVQFLGCLYLGYEVARTELVTRESVKRYWRPAPRLLLNIAEQGFPNTVDYMGTSLGFFVLTYFVARFGQASVAALGAGSRIEQIFLLPLLGLNVAVLALVAQNNGAQALERVQETYRTSLRYGMSIMFITMLLAWLLARPLMHLFTDAPYIIDTGVIYVRIRTLGLMPNALFFVSAAAMRGVQRPMPALLLNLARFVLLPYLLIMVLVNGLDYGLTAIFVSTTVAFVLTALIALWAARRILPRPESVGD